MTTSNNIKYELPIGFYNKTNEKTPLEKFNIQVHIEGFTPGHEYLENYDKLKSYIGQTLPVLFKKSGSYYCHFDGREIYVDEKTYQLSFIHPDYSSFDIDQFIHAIQAADISNDFSKIFQSLTFGYLESHITNLTPFKDALIKWAEQEPSFFLLVVKSSETSRSMYYPSFNNISEFEKFMTNELKEFPKHIDVVKAYCIDWEKNDEKSLKKVKKLFNI